MIRNSTSAQLSLLEPLAAGCETKDEDVGAQSLRTQVPLPDDPSLVPITYIGQLTTTCNSTSMGSNAHFWPPWAPTHTWLTHK